MAWLEIKKFNGKDHIAVFYNNPHVVLNKEWRDVRYIEITEEQSKWALEALRSFFELHKMKEEQAAKQTSKFNHLLEEIVGYIKTSHHAGERNNAKDLYFKITGMKYIGPEYQDK